MMKSLQYKCILVLISIVFCNSLASQIKYFQQEVNYNIKVTLIDSIHTIKGNIEIEYKNNAPETLKEIYIHLWGNAFKNKSTAFAKQKLRNHDTKFYFADPDSYGFYKNLAFEINGKKASWTLDEEHIDIAKVEVPNGLKNGEIITISTPFTLKIPASYSRLGHVGTSYQMTQWYPKPAVYDHNGWHSMPYLDLGEYYSEFGDYEVAITLPDNYFVGATGTLQNEDEKQRILDRIEYTETYLQDSLSNHSRFPESSKSMKTLKYLAENVHDFAWFADKRFLIQSDIATLSSGAQVDCYSFFTDKEKNLWSKSAFYVKRAVEFYSDRVGDYPYPQATAVQSALSAGGGMEYPMITVIGLSGAAPSLDQVITHEVGHNWFYGILASNERDHAWMDEGFNSFHDHKYMDIYYDDFDELQGLMPKRIKKQLEYSSLSYVYHIWARMGKDQAPNTTSDDLTSVNYFLGAYEKPAMSLKLLEQYVGEEAFKNAMRAYYDEWKFKHPQPEDAKASLENALNMNLDWLFDGLMYTNLTYDYKINAAESAKKVISVSNNGKFNPPFSITYLKEGKVIGEQWYEGFIGDKSIDFSFPEADMLEIDKEKLSLDINPSNDDRKANGGPVLSKPSIKFLSGIRTSKKSKVFILPTFGGNKSDGIQLGLAMHNYGIPVSTFQYYIQPAMGTRSEELIGSFEFRKDLPQKGGTLRNISMALGGKSFHEFYNEESDYNIRFTRIMPSIELEWQEKLVSPVKHFLRYRPIILVQDRALFGRETGFEGLEQNTSTIHELAYEYYKSSPINPIEGNLVAEYRRYNSLFNASEQYLKLYGSLDAKFAYKSKRFFNVRLFGGFFPFYSDRGRSTSSGVGNFSLFHRGFNDYRYDQHFLDRNGQSGFLSRQVTWSDGGFKNGITNAQPIGLSNNFMASTNISIDLPFSWTNLIPIKPYIDAGIYSYKPTSSEPFRNELLYSGGVMLDFQKVVGVYLPLFYSDQISSAYGSESGIFDRISFSIDINELNPHKLKRWFTR